MDPAMQAMALVAASLADPARVAILAALVEGEATVSDLVERLALPQPRISTHLARLRAAGLVRHAAIGRHRAYRVDARRIERLLDALAGDAAVRGPARSVAADRERRGDTPIRRARTCYDHLAGVAGVALLDAMRRRGWLRARDGEPRGYRLTAAGARALAHRDVDVEAAQRAHRHFARACLDWTERRPHLGGALGAEILSTLVGQGYVRRRRGARDVRVVEPLARWLGR